MAPQNHQTEKSFFEKYWTQAIFGVATLVGLWTVRTVSELNTNSALVNVKIEYLVQQTEDLKIQSVDRYTARDAARDKESVLLANKSMLAIIEDHRARLRELEAGRVK